MVGNINGAELPSAAACCVGRTVEVRLTLEEEFQQAVVIAYDPSTNQHTLELKQGGKIIPVILAKIEFKWFVQPPKPNQTPNLSASEHLALIANRDAVGRKLEIYSKKFDKYYGGEIVGFVEEAKRHKILFVKGNQTKLVDLKKHTWRFTDLVEGKNVTKAHTLLTSKFVGVRRKGEFSWEAHHENSCLGSFPTEKEAALAYDVYARRAGRPTNFQEEHWTEKDVMKCKASKKPLLQEPKGRSKYRGVYWTGSRWVARIQIRAQGIRRNIYLGSFSNERQAALAFDAGARKYGRPDSYLNFPNEHVSNAQIRAWDTKSAQFFMKGCGQKSSSEYRGVSKKHTGFYACVGYRKVARAYGGARVLSLGTHRSEKQAALLYDKICREHGVEENRLNFPCNTRLAETRLFDDECYFCREESPLNPLATPCNHVFCSSCVDDWFQVGPACPCCHTPVSCKTMMRPVTLDTGETDSEKIRRRERIRALKEKMAKASRQDAHVVVDPVRSAGFIRYPVGTRFAKKFVEETLEGVILSFDGKNYEVRYEDGVIGQLTQKDFDYDDLEILPQDDDTWSIEGEDLDEERDPSMPRFPVGTRFLKNFKGYGKYEGRIMSFDGEHYKVFYARDNDEEELSEHEFDGRGIEILSDWTVAMDDSDDDEVPIAKLKQSARKRASHSCSVPRREEQPPIARKRIKQEKE